MDGGKTARTRTDAYVRTIFITSLIGAPIMAIAPLTGSATWNLALLWPGTIIAGSYLGVMAVSFVVITPNEMRGQITAVYLFVTNILGMAVGTSILAAFTDFLYQDDALLFSAAACGVFTRWRRCVSGSVCRPTVRLWRKPGTGRLNNRRRPGYQLLKLAKTSTDSRLILAAGALI